MTENESTASTSPARLIDELGDWRGDGLICTGEAYRNHVKTTFAKGASLDDPAGLFNSSLDGNVRRAIDIHEGEPIDEEAFTALVRAAVDLNRSKQKH